MRIEADRFEISTDERFEIQNVTPSVEDVLAHLDVTDGLVMASTPHTSAALFTNEYEPELAEDLIRTMTALVPPNDGYFHDVDHIAKGEDPNAHAHIISAMIKRPVFLLVRDGDLDLGTWEAVLFFELCGPRDRTIDVRVLQ